MDLTVFDVFQLSDYEFLELSEGTVRGNIIVNTYSAQGVFKLRNGMNMINNQELRQSTATLHVKPTESFIDSIDVGQGIRCQGQDYRIVGQTGGDNYHNGVREHYTLTLQNTDFSNYTESS